MKEYTVNNSRICQRSRNLETRGRGNRVCAIVQHLVYVKDVSRNSEMMNKAERKADIGIAERNPIPHSPPARLLEWGKV